MPLSIDQTLQDRPQPRPNGHLDLPVKSSLAHRAVVLGYDA